MKKMLSGIFDESKILTKWTIWKKNVTGKQIAFEVEELRI